MNGITMKMYRCVAQVALVFLTAAHVTAQSPDARGTLTGCVVDTSGQPLPGVRVDVSAAGVHRTIFSNTAGCYELTNLPRESYVAFARLEGFASVTRDQLAITPGRTERVDLQMRIHPACECIAGSLTIESLWKDADAVVRLRIIGHEAGPAMDTGALPDLKHHATVLSVLKEHPMVRSTSTTLSFMQSQLFEEKEPYAVGQEFVVFLGWQPARDAFIRLNTHLGPAAFAIENGRLHSAVIEEYTGSSAAAFLAELEPMSRRQ